MYVYIYIYIYIYIYEALSGIGCTFLNNQRSGIGAGIGVAPSGTGSILLWTDHRILFALMCIVSKTSDIVAM